MIIEDFIASFEILATHFYEISKNFANRNMAM